MIENRQKTPSGPQGVLLGVPRDPQTTQMAIQDAKMCLPKLTNIRLWWQKVASQKAGESRIGGRRQRAKPLRYAAPGLGLP